MTSYRSLNHTKWACQYHVVFARSIGRAIYADLRRYLGHVLRRLAQRRESEVEEAFIMSDATEVLGDHVIGYIKGKSDPIARNFAGRPRNFVRLPVHGGAGSSRRIRAYIQDAAVRATSVRR